MGEFADYKGFEIWHDTKRRLQTNEDEERLIVKGQNDYTVWVNPSSPTGIFTRLDNFLATGLQSDAKATQNEMERLQQSLTAYEENKDNEFPKEEEYQEGKTRLAELKASELSQNSKSKDQSQNIEEAYEIEM